MSEQPIYSTGGITVTATSVVMDGYETPLADVATVSVARKRFEIVWTVVLCVLLVLTALHTMTVFDSTQNLLDPAADLGILLGIVIMTLIVASKVIMRPYQLVMETKAGEHKAHIGRDPNELEAAKAAIDGAKGAAV
ncbi:DUF6232 family protein [Chachezhania antarctica]|uniref:DUF6232 family protein n=1 Tax=Chachezhania antarctica TaxID=2340860 RepID=UPI000EB4F0D0|nr:DUF6232 family protein [Chachezhania antarctica]|tara:strand:+ start:2119 stop:2529 length:411 start_codon:yes stop_codon:yes gene_type:complete